MATIQIRNIGPLKDTGVIQITPVLLFLGKQSSGKSTLMKILCYCRWIEKRLMVFGNDVLYQYTHYQRFFKELKRFHRLDDSFFSDQSFISYESELIKIMLSGNKSNVKIEKKPDFDKKRFNSKLSFIPSERNLSAAIRNIDKAYKSNELDSLFNFIFEWGEARENYTPSNPLPLSVADNMQYFFNPKNESDYIRLTDADKAFSTFYASSGVQSSLPIEVMTHYLISVLGKFADISKATLQQVLLNILKDAHREEVDFEKLNKDKLIHLLNYQSIQLFIEEPEQNLYPESQKQLILFLIGAIKQATEQSSHSSYITLTTHSPYVVSTINVLMKAAKAYALSPQRTLEIIPQNLIFPNESISAYYIQDGQLESLVEKDLNMISGIEIDSVSDWVDNKIDQLNEIIYGN